MSSPRFRIVRPDARGRGYRFGPFEFEPSSGEIRKNGLKLKVRQQSLQILEMLLDRAGEVITREDIRAALWPDNTVEFDRGINTSMQRLRDALGDSADRPRYIETLARKGYRFIGNVERIEDVSEPATAPQEVNAESVPEIPPKRRRITRRLVAEVAATAVLTAISVIGWTRHTEYEKRPNWTLPLSIPSEPSPAPDGSGLLWKTANQVFYRDSATGTDTPIYKDAAVNDEPVWSWDGSQALFQTRNGLTRVPVPNGPPVLVWLGPHITRGYSWGPDGSILVAWQAAGLESSLYLVDADKGEPKRLEIPRLSGGVFYEPEFLPGGRQFLFTWGAADEKEAGIYLASLRNGKPDGAPVLLRRNTTAGHFGWSANNRLLYLQDDVLYAQKLNLDRRMLDGAPEKIVPDVLSRISMRHALFHVSRNGALVWKHGRADRTQLTWFDRAGNVIGKAGPPGQPISVRLAPDGKHLLIDIDVGASCVLEPDQNSYWRLPLVSEAIWGADGTHVFYTPRGGGRILERDLASGQEREILANVTARLQAVSPDGRALLFVAEDKTYLVRLDLPPSKVRPTVFMAEHVLHISVSPDGKWIVYSTYIASVSRTEIFVRSLSAPGIPRQISTEGGANPVWRGDGREILYRNGNRILSVRIRESGDRIDASAPQDLFNVRVPASLVGDSQPLAVTPDGSRILFAQAPEPEGPPTAFLMTAWDQMLKH
jgi:DNA-binding winged helix-turn-helix (wHTH) protein/Tol biopolymer transport system component